MHISLQFYKCTHLLTPLILHDLQVRKFQVIINSAACFEIQCYLLSSASAIYMLFIAV